MASGQPCGVGVVSAQLMRPAVIPTKFIFVGALGSSVEVFSDFGH